jgi:hypothetical protein
MADQPQRIILHPGFHKTGTSSMQHLLWLNRALLAPHALVLLLRQLRPVAKLCAAYSRNQNPLALIDLADELTRVFDEAPDPEGRDILLSCEGLSGHLPGWPGVSSYDAAPLTISYVAGFLAERFPRAETTILLTTRDAEGWLWSAWRHHLRGQRLTRDWTWFRARYAAAADLDAVALAVAEAAEGAAVLSIGLDRAVTHSLGPGGVLIDQLRLPAEVRRQIVTVKPGNRGPDAELAAEFLALNRSDLSDDAVRARKDELADLAEIGGWRR